MELQRSLLSKKKVQADTRKGCSDIKYKPEKMKMYHFKHEIPKANLQITECMDEISIAGETYSEIARQKFTLYSTSSCPIFKDYMETRRIEWE